MFGHIRELVYVARKDNSKLEASPIFFWVFTPIIFGSMVTNWFDLRLFLGLFVWVATSYLFGYVIIRNAKRMKAYRN